jgi:phosphatidylinositol dimannoside acyltransferase
VTTEASGGAAKSETPDTTKRLTDALTASSYRFGALAAQLTPGPVGQGMAALVGATMTNAMRSKRSMVERHQLRVNPQLKGLALRNTVQQAFESYARYYVESFRLPSLSKAAVLRGMKSEGVDEYLVPVLQAGDGAIIALPHLGGWEWAGRWFIERGFKMSVVVEPLANKEVFDWFVDLRQKLGMNVIPLGPSAALACSKALKDGHVLALLSDRDIGGGGIEVDFFGERTRIPAGPAMLGLRHGAPILPTAVYYTDRNAGHLGLIRPPIPAERRGGLREDVSRVTQLLAYELEFLIRRAPEQWHLFQPNWPSDPGYEA